MPDTDRAFIPKSGRKVINIPYRAATFLGRRNRRNFMERVPTLPAVIPQGEVPATVYSLSGESDWPEQVASIRSFLRFVGSPKRFFVVSDGSHTAQTIRTLEQIDSCVRVCSLQSIVKRNLSDRIQRYAAQHFLGKKLSL